MRNFLVVLCLVALAAQFVGQPDEKSEAFRQDVLASLPLLWKHGNARVDLTSGGDLTVSLAFPPRTRERQKRWTYPFLRFLAQRHPGFSLRKLKVYENERQVEDLLACRAMPAFYDDADERKSELIGRQLTAEAERNLGRGRILFLADVKAGRNFGSVPNVFYAPRVQERLHLCAIANGPMDEGYWKRELRNAESFRVIRLPQARNPVK